MKSGKIGVTSENIFPIIKKFLYSDYEIFLRELVSNAVDATRKMQTLASVGEFKGELGDVSIRIAVDPAARTLTVSDSGIGMTAEEVDKYLNQIAFSSAGEFLEKYQNQSIIGHFGLGFYSAFIVADRVEVRTRSWQDGAKTVVWTCDGTPEYTLTEDDSRPERGTDVILHLSEDHLEFTEEGRVGDLLKKYCRFLPVPIVFGKVKEWKDGKYVDTDKDNVINDTDPLWMRKPAETTGEQYRDFYRELYPAAEDPLFYIHLNIDYPFNLTGILYFPKIRNNFEIQKNKIQLYSNQVYVTDSVEGIVPEFLTLLHGVIDSPDIPLNVSRSYLQGDPNVRKISSYITRKVADRLQELFNTMRDDFESKWDDLKVFIQYGVVTDEKFAEKADGFMLVRDTEGKYYTFEEYNAAVKENQTDKTGTLIYLYTDDAERTHSFVQSAQSKGYNVLLMNGQLDGHFVNWYEQKNREIRFVRVDSDVVEKLIRKEDAGEMALSAGDQELLVPVFESQLPQDPKIHYNIEFEPMPVSDPPVVIIQNEYTRRMKEMAAKGGGGGMSLFYEQMPDSYTIAVNGNHPLVVDVLDEVREEYGSKLTTVSKKIEAARNELHNFEELVNDKKDEDFTLEEKKMREELPLKVDKLTAERAGKLREIGSANNLANQLIDLALLSSGMLKGESLTRFIRRSVELIGK